MKVIIATNNADKALEIKKHLNIDGWEFYTLKDLGLDSDPEETGTTFQENAEIKVYAALEAAKKAGLEGYGFLADDSGLCVDALDGGPGVYSARFADHDGQHCTYADNNKKLLAVMKDVPDDKRGAHFETVTVLIWPGQNYEVSSLKISAATGKCKGKIAFAPTGDLGFGYDPIFLPKAYAYKKSLSEVTREEKLKISHRGQSLSKLANIIRNFDE